MISRRSFLTGIRNFAIGLAISPSLEHFVPEILPAETRLPPSITESCTTDTINLVTKKEIFPKLIQDLFFTDSPFLAKLRDRIDSKYEFNVS